MYVQLISVVMASLTQIIDPAPPRHHRPLQNSVSLQSEKVNVRIVDGAATTELEQIFFNPSGTEAEETFIFPIPAETVVTDLSLTLDGKEIRGEVLDKDKARQIYNQIVSQRRDPALLEYVGQGLIRASLFPIPPRGEAKMKLKYTTVLRSTGGLFDYSFPLRLNDIATHSLRSITLDIQLKSSKTVRTIYSPSHKIDVAREGDYFARISSEGGQNMLERDFRLVYGVSDAEFGLNFLTYRKANGESYFLLFLSPRNDISPSKVQPKDIVFVLDTSGSMAGEKMKQAKDALKFCLNRLNPQDRFNVIRFSTESSKFRESLAQADSESVKQAVGFVEEFEARGGTNINEALESALASRGDTNRLFMICFLTDGLPTIGVTDVDTILSNARSKNSTGVRIFTFGVGDDVNTRLLDTLADETRATRSYVRPSENIEVAVSNFYDQISMPVLSNLSLTTTGMEIRELYPRQLPDLFKGSQLVVAGRFQLQSLHCGTPPLPTQTITLTGDVLGEKRSWSYPLDLYKTNDRTNDFIAPFWASRKVAFLLDEIRLRGSNPELVQEVTRLGKEFGILTPYTSHLVIEEQMRVSQNVRRAGLDGLASSAGPTPQDLAREKKAFEDFTEGKSEESGAGAVAKSSTLKAMAEPSAPAANSYVLSLDEKRRQNLVPKQVGDKLFFHIGEYWIESTITSGDPEKAEKIAFGSDEYFKLLEENPDIHRVLALGEKLLFKLGNRIIEVN